MAIGISSIFLFSKENLDLLEKSESVFGSRAPVLSPFEKKIQVTKKSEK
jgi:hypothetical protein